MLMRIAACRSSIAWVLVAAIASFPTTSVATAQEQAPNVRIDRIRFNPPGPDSGTNRHVNEEYVVIENHESRTINLDGWRLVDRGRDNRYVFDDIRLKPSERVFVHSGKGEPIVGTGCNGECHDTYFVFWGKPDYIWDNDADVATLKNGMGVRIDRCRYVKEDTSPRRC